MTNEIKFRAWHKHFKYMAPVARIDFVNRTVDLFAPHGPVYDIPLDDVELMQYIGLKDKNKKEIYSKDYVKVGRSGTYYRQYIREIPSWSREYIPEREIAHSNFTDDILYIGIKIIDPGLIQAGEVVGNSYENPELSKNE